LQTGSRNASSGGGSAQGSPWGATTAASGGAVTTGSVARIFVQRGGALTPVPVKVGIVGDTSVAVTPLRGTLSANDQVVIGDSRSASSPRSGTNTSTRGLLGGGGGRGPGG
jgi:hypothetical protein